MWGVNAGLVMEYHVVVLQTTTRPTPPFTDCTTVLSCPSLAFPASVSHHLRTDCGMNVTGCLVSLVSLESFRLPASYPHSFPASFLLSSSHSHVRHRVLHPLGKELHAKLLINGIESRARKSL